MPVAVDTSPAPAPKFCADVVGLFDGSNCGPPKGTVDAVDFLAVIQGFQGLPSAPHFAWADLERDLSKKIVNFSDVFATVTAVTGCVIRLAIR